MFHCLARTCADLVVGSVGNRSAWRQVYRALEHGGAKNACDHGHIRQFPDEIRDFANTFVTMQAKRHTADYDPHASFAKSTVLQDIAIAKQAIQGFGKALKKDRRAFCVWVLLKPPRK